MGGSESKKSIEDEFLTWISQSETTGWKQITNSYKSANYARGLLKIGDNLANNQEFERKVPEEMQNDKSFRTSFFPVLRWGPWSLELSPDVHMCEAYLFDESPLQVHSCVLYRFQALQRAKYVQIMHAFSGVPLLINAACSSRLENNEYFALVVRRRMRVSTYVSVLQTGVLPWLRLVLRFMKRMHSSTPWMAFPGLRAENILHDDAAAELASYENVLLYIGDKLLSVGGPRAPDSYVPAVFQKPAVIAQDLRNLAEQVRALGFAVSDAVVQNEYNQIAIYCVSVCN